MAYSTLDDLKKKIEEAALIELTDTTGSSQVDTATVTRAIRDADAVIDSYAGKVYMVPMSPAPHVVCDLSAAIAIYQLHRYRSIVSDVWLTAYENSVAFLKQVAEGKVTLEGAVAEPSPSSSPAGEYQAEERKFSRDGLKRF